MKVLYQVISVFGKKKTKYACWKHIFDQIFYLWALSIHEFHGNVFKSPTENGYFHPDYGMLTI